MSVHILTHEEVEKWREDFLQLLGASNEEFIEINAICDMALVASEALALLRELNDALAIPGWLQPRVDALLDRAEEKT